MAKMKKKSSKRRIDADGNPIKKKKKVKKVRDLTAKDIKKKVPDKKVAKKKKALITKKVAKAEKKRVGKESKRGTFWPTNGVKVIHKTIDGMKFKAFKAFFDGETKDFPKRAKANDWIKEKRDEYRVTNVHGGMRAKAKKSIQLYHDRINAIVIERYGAALSTAEKKIVSRISMDLNALLKEL